MGTWPVLLATGLAAERTTVLLRKRGVRMAGGLLVIVFGLWTLPGPLSALADGALRPGSSPRLIHVNARP
ncbi:Uncharacterized protein ALO35_03043 [Pseudomonas amygdali pv. lachrymans]|uniref:Uncharacterized protein n=1 Tax=Pseudomonas amygdali pv. lachrymans TaxID=53707 RepID=A0A0P9YBX7_PSEAV|nr:Uncharacterized protein ALO35_03043 [Pseudomonas amygdali pv. lachrymans]